MPEHLRTLPGYVLTTSNGGNSGLVVAQGASSSSNPGANGASANGAAVNGGTTATPTRSWGGWVKDWLKWFGYDDHDGRVTFPEAVCEDVTSAAETTIALAQFAAGPGNLGVSLAQHRFWDTLTAGVDTSAPNMPPPPEEPAPPPTWGDRGVQAGNVVADFWGLGRVYEGLEGRTVDGQVYTPLAQFYTTVVGAVQMVTLTAAARSLAVGGINALKKGGQSLADDVKSPAPPPPTNAAPSKATPEFFTSQSTWTAPSQGTGQSYKVFRQEIDWDLKVNGKTNAQWASEGRSPYVMKNGNAEQLQLLHSRQSAQGPLFEASKPTHLNTKSGAGREALHPYGKKAAP